MGVTVTSGTYTVSALQIDTGDFVAGSAAPRSRSGRSGHER
jgi:hypothetical protein